MSDAFRRRILRSQDAPAPASAALLIDLPAGRSASSSNSLKDIIDQARREGQEEGYRLAVEEMKQGESAGRAAQMRRVADALVKAAEAVRPLRHEAVQMGASEAVELACELAEAILERELAAGKAVADALARVVGLVPDEDDLVVRLHPGDGLTPEELTLLLPNARVRVVADPRIEPGSCVVVAGPCRIDAQVGAALDRARRVLDELYPDRATPVEAVA